MADFEGPSVDARFRRLLTNANPIRWEFFHHLHTSAYYHDRLILIGDSAHASLPFPAASGAQGIEDALVLSSVLVDLATASTSESNQAAHVHTKLNAYDSVR
jgi:salicylate hydroxylase